MLTDVDAKMRIDDSDSIGVSYICPQCEKLYLSCKRNRGRPNQMCSCSILLASE